MARIAKRLQAARKEIDTNKVYGLKDALALVKKHSNTKFDETVDLALNLGVDPKHADQMVRGTVSLPNGIGKTLSVLVFAKGPKAEEAKKAGADFVGDDDLADKVAKGEVDFDRCIATPDMMATVGKLGRVLGPKGLMPNPKLGTVTMDIAEAVKAAKGGQVEFRVEKAGIIHAGVGKTSFSEKALEENVRALVEAVNKSRPTGAKGTYMRRMALSSSMGVGIKVDVATLAA